MKLNIFRLFGEMFQAPKLENVIRRPESKNTISQPKKRKIERWKRSSKRGR